MKNQNFTFSMVPDIAPESVFEIISNPTKWWIGLYNEKFKGNWSALGDEFSFEAGNGAHFSKQKVVEWMPFKRLVWLITDSNLTFTDRPSEWTGTRIVMEIYTEGEKTHFTFTHEGLTPEMECYESCAPSWFQYLHSKLLPLLKGNLLQATTLL